MLEKHIISIKGYQGYKWLRIATSGYFEEKSLSLVLSCILKKFRVIFFHEKQRHGILTFFANYQLLKWLFQLVRWYT